jgi:RNA polymerase sigma-70 factor (ECF subfamily)
VASLDFRSKPDGKTLADFIADPSEPVIEKLARDEARRAVVAGFAELPEPQREVLMVCDVEGLDYKQAAKRLRVPMGTVRSRLFRARAALRRDPEIRLLA